MERNKYCWLLLGILLPILSFSQKKKKDGNYTFLSVPNVVVDGNLTEWEGKFYQKEGELWQCALSREGDSLYAAVLVKDPILQNEAILRGILLNLSYNDKKKDGAQLIFPMVDRESIRALRQDEDRDKSHIKQDMLQTSRGYFVKGFTKVRDGLLSFQNDYGVKAAVQLDSNQNLLYEAVVPLDLIKFKADQIAVQVAINTQYMQMQKASKDRPSNNMGMYGIYRPMTPTLKDPYEEKTEIWVTGSIK